MRINSNRLDVYKAAGKVFLTVTDDPGEQTITVKCEPEHAQVPEHGYASITPGRYLGRRHWIPPGPGPGVTERLIAGVVEDSCDLVAERLPRRDRPVPDERRGPPERLSPCSPAGHDSPTPSPEWQRPPQTTDGKWIDLPSGRCGVTLMW
ncbi:MmcQ/YjbR family DNA-binding protein [Streptomyces acidiscabies]|uniref:MmcQ/YjbR family DNA-binding protein n=1 Tax=Streptomyces acidiscabies TaxID=42234 RepID=UPI00099DB668|nr:MmcQ/YjbR family DNA-binding protein [Streptomyces acidiscabies]